MPINFFKHDCQDRHVTDAEFGLCDEQNGQRAFVDRENRAAWVAVVENGNEHEITFTGIDNCIEIFRDSGDMERRCDGMLTSAEQIIFVELKDQRCGWISDAIKQLASTIRCFQEQHDISVYSQKKAFACNRRHPHFQVMDNTRKQRFYNEFRVRLNIQATIEIT